MEDKLEVILQELGIDKMQDVLDEGSADIDFTNVYISTIANPKSSDYQINNFGKDIQKQVDRFNAIQGLIHEDKELQGDRDAERQQHSFHMMLKNMIYEYDLWKGYAVDERFDLDISVSNPNIQRILNLKQIWHPNNGIQDIHFVDMKSESGIFSLWELSLGEDATDKRIIALFVNDAGIYRPVASKKIWDEMLKKESRMDIGETKALDPDLFRIIQEKAQENALDSFLQMKAAYEERHEANFKKHQRALTLRIEAAQRIGIENIRNARVNKLESQLQQIRETYERQQEICPTFTPVLVVNVR